MPPPKKRRAYSLEIPQRFMVDEEEEEMMTDDAARPDQAHPETFVQQSMYGVIAAAHSKGTVRPGFHPEDSGSDTDTDAEGARRNSRDLAHVARPGSSARSSLDERRERHRQALPSRHRKSRTAGGTTSRSAAATNSGDTMSESQILPSRPRPASSLASASPQNTPILDRKIQARAKAEMESSAAPSTLKDDQEAAKNASRAPVALPNALAEIFHFDEPEDVVAEYACWYLQSALLQGYMYITQKHVCFYAYLQKKGNVIKSGHLGKQGKRNPHFRRYWFTLKGDILSYFSNASDLYFPRGSIDLRYAIAAELSVAESDLEDDAATPFTITTEKRSHHFRADTATAAKEWVRQLQRVIFRSHNDGDSVKIAIPLESIVDVEPTSAIEQAGTVKLRVVDGDETYAVDEYFFTFFNHGKDALSVLTIMTQGNHQKHLSDEAPVSSSKGTLVAQKTLSNPLATGPPHQERESTKSNRKSAGFSPRKRADSTVSQSSQRSQSPSAKESSESLASEEISELAGDEHDAGMDMTASQILTAPTLRTAHSKHSVQRSATDRLRREAQSTSSPKSAADLSRDERQSHGRDERAQTLPLHDSAMLPRQPTSVSKQPQSLPALFDTTSQVVAAPLQHAYYIAGAVRDQGKRMGSYLSSSPKTYYDKFSGAIAGGKRHYSEADGLATDDRTADPEQDLDTAEHERRFQEHFALPSTERLRAIFYCWLHRVLPLYGKIYVSDRRLCFRSLLYGTRTKLVVPFSDVDNVTKERGFRWGYPGMVLVVKGREELFFDFGSRGVRDDCTVTLLRGLDVARATLESPHILTEEEKLDAEEAAAEHELLQDARSEKTKGDSLATSEAITNRAEGDASILFDDPNASILDFRPKQPMRITCLTIGSRGDVQPYIALCKGLAAQGHHVKIATHLTFQPWIEEYGIEFAPVDGDPGELMRLCVELGMFTPAFIYETGSFARTWLQRLLGTAWLACQNSDLLIESPSAMCGIHIAEALGIPYFRAFTMPWTRTRAYPHAFATPNQKMGGRYNYMTYVLFEKIFWQMTAGQINRWRRKELGLGPTDLGKMQLNKVPFLYNFSPSVVVPPLDFSDWIRVTGYWFLDEGDTFTPEPELIEFIRKAKEDKVKLVYIGFGSIPIADSAGMTKQIIEAVRKADVRCIFSKGWSDIFDGADSDSPAAPAAAAAPVLPPEIYHIRAAPHDWLFKQIDCAVHHGGAGTTGASLRAGVPTVIKPFFGDQFFFASRVEDLGVGLHVKKITPLTLGKAIWLASHDERMRGKARRLGEKIRREDGVGTAITAIYRDLEYARSLIKKSSAQDDNPAVLEGEGEEEDAEESWTFVDNQSDVDVTESRRVGSSEQGYGRLATGLSYRLLSGRR